MQKGVSQRKSLNKIFILMLKYIPVIIALCYSVNTLSILFNWDTQFLSTLGGLSVLSWTFLYTASWIFSFCIYHRLLLYYILVDDIINLVDYYFQIPLINSDIVLVHSIIIGIFIILITYIHVKHSVRSLKVDNR